MCSRSGDVRWLFAEADEERARRVFQMKKKVSRNEGLLLRSSLGTLTAGFLPVSKTHRSCLARQDPVRVW